MNYLDYKRFNVADVVMQFESDIGIRVSEEFQAFYETDIPDYTVIFQQVNRLECCKGKLINKLMGVRIYLDDEGDFFRQFQEEKRNAVPYAIQRSDWKHKKITVTYLKEGKKNIDHTNGAFFHCAWEDIMLREQRLILHACCVETRFGGILFSGRSGIGKSTQGDLWCRYETAKLINGDRPILCKNNSEGKWLAYGSPYAGSSRCHVNAKVPVKVIVMLQQAEKCSIRRLNRAEAFTKIYAQLTVSTWDPACVRKACDLTEQLVTDIPIYEMACTPDYEAVKLLTNTIRQEVKV